MGSLLRILLSARRIEHELRGGLVEDMDVCDGDLVSGDEIGASSLEVGIEFVHGVFTRRQGGRALFIVVLVSVVLSFGEIDVQMNSRSEVGNGPVEPLVNSDSLLKLRGVDACGQLFRVGRGDVSQLGGTLGDAELFVDLEVGQGRVTIGQLGIPLFPMSLGGIVNNFIHVLNFAHG